jgi:hypothetical protein
MIRYGIDVAKGSKVAKLLVEPSAKREDYKVVKGVLIETDVLGKTSFSDAEIRDIGRFSPIRFW